MNDVAHRGLGWRCWPTRVVTATKSEQGN
jgi:hypothetical protein